MSFHNLYYQIVFSTKNRRPIISESVERDVYTIIYKLLLKYGGYVHRIGGMPDHIHILATIPPAVAVSEVIKVIKQESSKGIRNAGIIPAWNGWEEGYGVFSYSHADLEKIKNYIAGQKAHHRHVTFADEYRQWLVEQGIDPSTPYFPKY